MCALCVQPEKFVESFQYFLQGLGLCMLPPLLLRSAHTLFYS